MGAQDLPRRRSLGERGPANEANAARSSAQNPPPPRGRASSTPACSAPACSTPGISSAGEALGGGHPRQRFDAGGQGGTAMGQNGGISEGGCGGEAERTKQKATQLCFEKKESGGAVNSGRWRAVNWGEQGATGCAKSDQGRARGAVGPARTRRAGWPGCILCIECTQV